MAVAVPKDTVSGCSGYDAYICAAVNPDRVVPRGSLLRIYEYAGEDFLHTAAVSLYDSGEYIFTFSPVSSYFGYGEYVIENDRLTLNTDDGQFTYVFDIVGDTLIFDADASSEQMWFSGITDGAVFE